MLDLVADPVGVFALIAAMTAVFAVVAVTIARSRVPAPIKVRSDSRGRGRSTAYVRTAVRSVDPDACGRRRPRAPSTRF